MPFINLQCSSDDHFVTDSDLRNIGTMPILGRNHDGEFVRSPKIPSGKRISGKRIWSSQSMEGKVLKRRKPRTKTFIHKRQMRRNSMKQFLINGRIKGLIRHQDMVFRRMLFENIKMKNERKEATIITMFQSNSIVKPNMRILLDGCDKMQKKFKKLYKVLWKSFQSAAMQPSSASFETRSIQKAIDELKPSLEKFNIKELSVSCFVFLKLDSSDDFLFGINLNGSAFDVTGTMKFKLSENVDGFESPFDDIRIGNRLLMKILIDNGNDESEIASNPGMMLKMNKH